MTRPPSPASLRLLIIALLAAAAGVAINPRAAAAGALAAGRDRALAAGAELVAIGAHAELALLLANPGLTRMRSAKRRAEESLIDFVELMWPVLEREQPFVRSWVQEAICQHLEAVTAGRLTNVLMNVPPGSTKTYLTCVFWPAWEWGPRDRPDLRFMSWSYSPKLTEEANANCRKLIESEVYQRFWGSRFTIDRESDAKSYFRNDHGGWMRSSSVGGASTGFRADRLIWDDPHNVKDVRSIGSTAKLKEATHWFSKSLPTRVRNASDNIAKVKVPFWVREIHGMPFEDDPLDKRKVTASATIGIMQRVHQHDLSGIVLKHPALGYEVLLIEMRFKGDQHPARMMPGWRESSIGYKDPRTKYGDLADPIRFPEEAVAKLEASLMLEGGSEAVAAQLDQWPFEVGGSWFKVEWLPIMPVGDVPPDVPRGKRGWDLGGGGESANADPSASARLARGGPDKKFYLWHTAKKRGSPGDVEQFIKKQHAEDDRSIDWSIPEDPGTGKLYADYIKRECAVGRYVTSSPEAKDKVTRAKPVSGQAQVGQFVIVDHPGAELARAELVDFPYGEHDDIVDAISRAFAAVIKEPEQVPTVFGGYIVSGAS